MPMPGLSIHEPSLLMPEITLPAVAVMPPIGFLKSGLEVPCIGRGIRS